MKEFLKKNWSLLSVGLITVVLAVVAIGTAWKLYQAGSEPVAPTAPASVPKAQEEPTATPVPEEPCVLEFEVPSGTPTPTPTISVPECWDECTDECSGDLVCQEVDGTDRCVNEDCPEEEDCECPGTTPTPTPTGTVTPTPTPGPTGTPTPGPTATPTPTSPPPPPGTTPTPTPTPTPVELPEAGISLPTIGALLGGLLLITLSVILAL